MRLIQFSVIPLCATIFSGCLTPPPERIETNWSHVANLMVTNTAINDQFAVKATVYEIRTDSTFSANELNTSSSKGDYDLLSAPQFTVESGTWSEVRVCSDPYNPYSVVARLGEEDVRISMSPGVVMRIKVNPIADGKLHCVGVLAIGSTRSADDPGFLRVYPFNLSLSPGEETTILRMTCNQ